MISGTTINALAGYDREQALAAGFSPGKIKDWALLHDVYFGPTQAVKQQASALDLAQKGAFTLDQLVMVERALKRIRRARARMKLRLRILQHKRNYRTLSALVRKLVPKPAPKPVKRVAFSKSRDGLRTVTATADERDVADLEHHLNQGIDPAQPAGPQLLGNLLTLLRGEGGGVAHAAPRPMVLVPLPDYVRILGGEGDDVVLGLTDATTMTGAEFLQAHLGEQLEVAAFHPQAGPVNLYRTERLANRKQRDLARAAMPVCPFPGCRQGADLCEIHHIEAWSRGGETNLANLSPLCRYHNRVNDDDPERARRGRIENVAGTPTWCSPGGFAVANPYHPFAAMRTLFP